MKRIKKFTALIALVVTAASLLPVHLSLTEAKTLPTPISKEDTRDEAESREILWLARAIQSETKSRQRGEMAAIGCVIYNRVQTGYRGTTYEEVVRAKNQFSGLNPGDPNYRRNISLVEADAAKDPVWKNALRIAAVIYDTGDLICPAYFPETVRHFYSPSAMHTAPGWAVGEKPVHIIGENLETARFAFYADIQ